jgi:CheY-like chemotaxis protein
MSATAAPQVLVVDDDPRSRELMTLILRHAGFGVVVAEHPRAAIALLATIRPALALVDFMMPGMDGLEFCSWVRLQPERAAMRVVLLTGMDTVEVHADAAAAGADAVVIKPIDRVQLLSQLNSLLGLPAAR